MQRDDRPRSLERKSMETIFAPLDDNEPLPRELIQEARRYRALGRRELAGALWLPVFAAVLVLAGWANVNGPVVLAVLAILLIGFVAFAMSGERK
ncbi:MAG: hypothetical protein E6I23_11955 [Chloroflexi bacterium]|nr:MAG: hypothetical protein AUH32_03335 [Actinobacteria bacterium 13_1_40CM_66_12]TMF42956.1 MAG: hypothetical protein E6I23_11955 [Chloroflexota bacterium]